MRSACEQAKQFHACIHTQIISPVLPNPGAIDLLMSEVCFAAAFAASCLPRLLLGCVQDLEIRQAPALISHVLRQQAEPLALDLAARP